MKHHETVQPLQQNQNKILDNTNAYQAVNNKTVRSCSLRILWRKVMTVTMLPRSKSKKQAKNEENAADFPFLDLPELVLESILTGLAPYDLCQLAQTCTELRQRCRGDNIWEPLFNKRWGKYIGAAAFATWRRVLHQNARFSALASKPKGHWIRYLKCIGYFSRHGCKTQSIEDTDAKIDESFVNFYWYLENGEFWFPAHVYNRENHHVGFILSCYDAELSYDSNSDTFSARYAPQSLRSMVVEDGISWERIRKPALEISPNELYIPDVAEELRPGDHIEVQWKRSHTFPYGWWYGVVGHADNCKSEDQNCKCHYNEMVWLEFRQYSRGSKWRRVQLRRNRIQENGNESDGIYGGIRKLHDKEDISAWLQMWPKETLK